MQGIIVKTRSVMLQAFMSISIFALAQTASAEDWNYPNPNVQADLNDLRQVRDALVLHLANYDAGGRQNPENFLQTRGADLKAQHDASDTLRQRISVAVGMNVLRMADDARFLSANNLNPKIEKNKVEGCRWRTIPCVDDKLWAKSVYMGATDNCDNYCSGDGCQSCLSLFCGGNGPSCTPFNVVTWLTCGAYPVFMALVSGVLVPAQGISHVGVLPGRCICPTYKETKTFVDLGVTIQNEIDAINTFRANVQTHRDAVPPPASERGSIPMQPMYSAPPAGYAPQPVFYPVSMEYDKVNQ